MEHSSAKPVYDDLRGLTEEEKEQVLEATPYRSIFIGPITIGPDRGWDIKRKKAKGFFAPEELETRAESTKTYLTLREAADYIGLSYRALYSRITKPRKSPNALKAQKAGSRFVFTRSNLDEFLAKEAC